MRPSHRPRSRLSSTGRVHRANRRYAGHSTTAWSPSAMLSGIHRGWGEHLVLGTNLIIDHFLQERDWSDETLDVIEKSGARIFSVGVYCSVQELERREASRADGELEGRPLGLARRSNELCHSHGLEYDVTVWTDQQTTEESVDAIVAALYSLQNGAPRPEGNS